LIAALLLLILFMVPRAAAAGQSERYGHYIVYYSAISTDLLSPDVARAYGYQRSSHKGLVNIAIKRDASNGVEQAVAGKVDGSAVNLSGQRVPVDFQQVKEGDVVYYLGTFPISGNDTVRFRPDNHPGRRYIAQAGFQPGLRHRLKAPLPPGEGLGWVRILPAATQESDPHPALRATLSRRERV